MNNKLKKEIKVGVKNENQRFSMVTEPYNSKCCMCRSKDVYTIVMIHNKPTIFFKQTGYKGVNYVICSKCYNINSKINDIVFLVCRFILSLLGRIKWKDTVKKTQS